MILHVKSILTRKIVRFYELNRDFNNLAWDEYFFKKYFLFKSILKEYSFYFLKFIIDIYLKLYKKIWNKKIK
jgi:hypothetical protein